MMSDDRLRNLEQRLATAEHDVEILREQLRAMDARRRPRSRMRRDGILGLLGASLLMFAVTRAINTEAQSVDPQVLTVKAPFQVVDAGGRVILKAEVRTGQSQLTVGNLASGGTTLGVGASGAGFLSVRTATGTEGLALGQYRGEPMGVRVIGPDGESVEGSLALDAANKGQLTVGDLQTGGTSVGVGKSGAGFVIVRRGDGKNGIALGQLEGRPMSVGVFGENAKELVTLGTGQKGGSVKVMTSTGAAVAALLAGDTGGGVALTGPAGGKSAVSLSVEPTGGKVKVFPQGGGSAQAELTAGPSGGGTVNVYNGAGEAVVWLEATSKGEGRLQVGRAGKVYVEAGVLPSGLGMVVAGPQVGGPPPGLVVPNLIMGRTGGK
jgi:hypothetical protein